MTSGNIYVDAEPPESGERFEGLLESGGVVVERILSSSAIDPVEYRQEQDEWVMLVRGEATLVVSGVETALTEGDYLFIEAGTPHTVVRVSEGAIWLALHIRRDRTAR